MKKNNPNYYSLEFREKQIKLNEYADKGPQSELDISDIINPSLETIGNMGKTAFSLGKFSIKNIKFAFQFPYYYIQAANELTPEQLKLSFSERLKLMNKKIKERRGSDLWEDYKNVWSSLSSEIDDNINDLDRQTKSLLSSAGLNDKQMFALLFSTNPALVLTNFLDIKNKKSRNKSSGASTKITDTASAIGNSLIDTYATHVDNKKIINYCKGKITNSVAITENYSINASLRKIINSWLEKQIDANAPELLYNKQFKRSLIKDLITNANQNKPNENKKLVRTSLTLTDETNENISNNLPLLKFDSKKMLLTEANVSESRSIVFNTLAWLIVDDALNKNQQDALKIITAVEKYKKKNIQTQEKEERTPDDSDNTDTEENVDTESTDDTENSEDKDAQTATDEDENEEENNLISPSEIVKDDLDQLRDLVKRQMLMSASKEDYLPNTLLCYHFNIGYNINMHIAYNNIFNNQIFENVDILTNLLKLLNDNNKEDKEKVIACVKTIEELCNAQIENKYLDDFVKYTAQFNTQYKSLLGDMYPEEQIKNNTDDLRTAIYTKLYSEFMVTLNGYKDAATKFLNSSLDNVDIVQSINVIKICFTNIFNYIEFIYKLFQDYVDPIDIQNNNENCKHILNLLTVKLFDKEFNFNFEANMTNSLEKNLNILEEILKKINSSFFEDELKD